MKEAIAEWICFRDILQSEAEIVAKIETTCFPPNEACKPEMMKKRVKLFPETFLLAENKKTGEIMGFINGLATDEVHLRDAFYTEPALHQRDGAQMMILGVNVLPAFQRQGIARAMMAAYLDREKTRGRKKVVLTCLEGKVSMYAQFGYTDLGVCDSEWGGEAWHEMYCQVND